MVPRTRLIVSHKCVIKQRLARVYSRVNVDPTRRNLLRKSEMKRQKRNKHETSLSLPVLPHLPWETLHLIFLRATVPGTLIVPDSRPHCAWNLNTKTKLRLISVCKDWYEAGISLLYGDVVIYSIVQFGALVSTLYKNPLLASQVISLRLSTYIPETALPLFEHLVETSNNVCLNLRCFSFEESFLVMDEANPLLVPTAIEVPPCIAHSTLTHLEIHSNLSIPFNHVLMSMPLFATHLESLIILAKYPEESQDRWLFPPIPSKPLTFPVLRVFQHQLTDLHLRFITAHWEFPVLDTLASILVDTVSTVAFTSIWEKDYIEASNAFLSTHGRRLRTLLLDWPTAPFDTTAAQEAIDTLSHLRHLIIPPFLDISASQVQWLDCFLKNNSVFTERLVLFSDHDRNNRFPNLLSYRVLDSELVRKLPLLSTLLPPTTEDCRFTFPGVDIRCDTSALWGSSASVWNKDELDYSSGGSDWEVDSDSDSSCESELDDEDFCWDGREINA
ncbi:hypothetical protein BDP27DRAFT_1333029 [Rhodocollybia butyracea]|uniref:F-box domain-containing protein n=1 Tax=Rhodocollybia butyracea TaxID=206335 RepID=A0A9P5PMQ0_9AGAR|nr:hypothetical protein BDP27DRAFT_1333029 [Rhodocollybia butyracea]